jgi:uncharacterized repeat protein (TIGR02543 family)
VTYTTGYQAWGFTNPNTPQPGMVVPWELIPHPVTQPVTLQINYVDLQTGSVLKDNGVWDEDMSGDYFGNMRTANDIGAFASQSVPIAQTHTVHYATGAGPTETVTNMPPDGMVKVGGNYTVSDLIPVREGYEFNHWKNLGVESAAEYNSGDTINNVTENITLTAQWNPLKYNLTSKANTGGSLADYSSADGSNYTMGTAVSVTAVPDDGYSFTHWEATGVTLTDNTNATASFNMPAKDVTLTAHFERDIHNLMCVAGEGGTVGPTDADEGTYTSSFNKPLYKYEEISVTAKADEGYEFTKWTAHSAAGADFLEDADENPADFEMPGGDVILVANFVPTSDPPTYSFVCAAGEGGGVKFFDEDVYIASVKGSYEMGTIVNVVAEANEGWHFTGWTPIPSDLTYTPQGLQNDQTKP